MARFYFDTSAIVKLYLPEPGSQWVNRLFSEQDSQGNALHTIALAKIGIVETAAALARLRRMGLLPPKKYVELYDLFLTDAIGRFSTILADDQVVLAAAELTQRHPLRGYDAVHLASALAFNRSLVAARLPPAIFVSADQVLCDAAEAEGLMIENPNTKP